MNPTPQTIKQARREAGHTQSEAAAVIYVHARTWQKYERGTRSMPRGLLQLYKIKTVHCLKRLFGVKPDKDR